MWVINQLHPGETKLDSPGWHQKFQLEEYDNQTLEPRNVASWGGETINDG
jgi:hypothetical protein